MTFDYSTIEEQFQKLPEEVQYALTSPHITEKIKEIAEKNGLLLDQMEALYDITSYVMLGLLPSDRYTSTLAREMNISEKQAKIITDEINNEVFLEIRNSMREFEEKSRSTNNVVSNFTQNQYNRSNNNQIPTTPAPSSPHADLEQAGDLKIENEVSTDTNYSLKSPPRKSNFVIEPKKEQPMSKLADMAMFAPKTEETEQLPKAEPEKPTLTQETVPTRVEQSTQETKPISTNTEQIVREYPIQKTPEPDYEPKKDSRPVFDPKNFYNFSNIETDSNIAKIENEFKKDNVRESDTKADSSLKSDSIADSDQVFQKSASQIHYEKEAKNKHSKMSASQSYQPKVREFVKIDTTQKDIDAEKIKNDIEKENTALIDELIAHPKPVFATTTEVKQMEPEKTMVVPEKTAAVTENKKTVEAPVNLPVEPVTPVVNLVSPNAETRAEKPVANKFVSAFDNKAEETKREIETKVEKAAKVETAPIIIPAIDPDIPPLVNLINRPVITTEELPPKEIPIKTTATENTPASNIQTISIPTNEAPTNEDIRRDIRSKVSEFNPTTKWSSPIPTDIENWPKENKTVLNENKTTAVENAPLNDFTLPKELNSAFKPIEIKPKPIVPPPISRPKGFDPYREALQ